jgi:P pilus assembly chaperone PapD
VYVPLASVNGVIVVIARVHLKKKIVLNQLWRLKLQSKFKIFVEPKAFLQVVDVIEQLRAKEFKDKFNFHNQKYYRNSSSRLIVLEMAGRGKGFVLREADSVVPIPNSNHLLEHKFCS